MKVTKRNRKTVKCRVFSWLLVLTLLMTSVTPVGATSFEGKDETLNSETENYESEIQTGDELVNESEADGEDEMAVRYTLSFYDMEGSQKYLDLELEAEEGERVQLPEVPVEEGQTALGWSSYIRDTEAEYEAGEEIEVTKNMDLYAVCEQSSTVKPEEPEEPEEPETKEVTVQFFDQNGKDIYPEFETTVEEGTQITLPTPDAKSNMRAMGWSSSKNAKSAKYRAGSQLTVTEDMVLYSVHQRLYTITFLTNTGKTTSRLEKLKIQGVWQEKIKLPKLPAYSGYTSDGWTNKKYSKKVTNKEESTYTVCGNRTLYQVNHKTKTYSVKFYNNDGSSSSSLNKLAKKVQEGKTIVLPSLPAKSGYERLGWTTKKKGTKAVYESGDSLKVTKDTKLYAVYRKITYCTIQFYNSKGTKAYSTLTEKVRKGTYITLPELPAVVGYRAVGWTKYKGAKGSVLDEEQRIYVSGSMKFYSYYKKSGSTLRFYTYNGSSEYTSIRMENAGKSAVMPTAFSPKGYTFLGWSTKKNQTGNPEYDMGQKYSNLKSSMKLYAVCKKKSQIESENAKMSVEVSEKYDQVIFLGDSRTYGTQLALENTYGGVPENVTFLCAPGIGLPWFEENYKSGENFYKTISEMHGKKAVIWNLGINNLIDGLDDVGERLADYTAVMSSVAEELKALGCDMYFMSINPTNDKEAASPNYGTAWSPRSPYSVRLFNWKLRENISNYYSYIDTYTYLIDTGFITYDGLHYGDSTYLKIYNKAIETIDR